MHYSVVVKEWPKFVSNQNLEVLILDSKTANSSRKQVSKSFLQTSDRFEKAHDVQIDLNGS